VSSIRVAQAAARRALGTRFSVFVPDPQAQVFFFFFFAVLGLNSRIRAC
jgi:hypothetical protein